MDEKKRARLYESLALRLPDEAILPVEAQGDFFAGGPARQAALERWDTPAIRFLDTFGARFAFDTPQAQITSAFYHLRDVLGADLRVLIEEPARRDEVRARLDPAIFEYLNGLATCGTGDSYVLDELRRTGKVPF